MRHGWTCKLCGFHNSPDNFVCDDCAYEAERREGAKRYLLNKWQLDAFLIRHEGKMFCLTGKQRKAA